jgi:hypothetical protein
VLCGCEQVQARVLESDALGNVAGLGRHPLHQAVVQGDVGDLVDDSGPGRQRPILDSQVRFTVGYAIAGPVPAPYGAVVQRQRAEFGNPALGKRLERVFDWIAHHDDVMAHRVFAKYLHDRVARPGLAETDPRREVARQLRCRTILEGALE